MNITPAIKEVQYLTKNVIENILREHPVFSKTITVYGAYTEKYKDNNGVYVNIRSREKEPSGVDNYGGKLSCFHMLSKLQSSLYPGTSLEWVWVDDGLYKPLEDQGLYLIKINSENTFSVDIYKKHTQILENRVGSNIQEYTLDYEPADPESVRVYINNFAEIRTVDYNVENSVLTFEKKPLKGYNLYIEYYYLSESIYDIDYIPENYTELKKGVFLFFSKNPVIGDELILTLHSRVKPSYHTYGSMVNVSISLMLKSNSKQTETELAGFLESKLDLELRAAYTQRGWSMMSLDFNEEEREDWDEGGYTTVSNSTFNISLSMQWVRMVPLVKELSGSLISFLAENKKD